MASSASPTRCWPLRRAPPRSRALGYGAWRAARPWTDWCISSGDKRPLGVTVCREGDRVGLELRVALDSGVNIRTTCANLQHQVRYRVQQECGVEVGRIDIIVETVKA